MSLKNEPAVRYAIWNAYNRRCQITKKLIESITDMEVDHIISVDIFKDKEKIKLYNLPKDFNIDGLENLRPVLRVWNREKSNQELPSELVILNLLKAKKIRKLVEREIEKYHEEKKYALNIEAIKETIRNKEITLEEFIDQMNDYQVDFGEEIIRTENNFINSIEVNSHTVRISAHLPRVEEREGNCLFTFNSFYLRNVNITLSHQEILKTLYKGLKTPLELLMRPYILENCLENEYKTYIITIGGCVFNLDKFEVNHLIRAIDIFLESYIKSIKKIECKLESSSFYPMLYNLNNYKLICITPNLFEQIILFTEKHDYESGESKWHIFDAHGKMIKVYDKNSGKYRCIIYGISENHDRYSWYKSQSDVWLVWDYMANSSEDLWSAKETYTWLIKDLIPAVETFFQTPSKGKIFRRNKSIIKNNTTIYTKNDKYFDSKTNVTSGMLLNIAERIQLMYSLESQVYMNWNNYLQIYESIISLVRICPNPDYHYISSKLDLGQVIDKEELLKKINQIKNQEQDSKGKMNCRKLDLLFRAFYVLVRDSADILTTKEITNLVALIEEPINNYNKLKLVESQYIE